MAITYKEIRRIQERWGIDVTVRFIDRDTGLDASRTFRFDDEKQIDAEFESRMARAITNIKNQLQEASVSTPEEKLKQIEDEIIKTGTVTIDQYNSITDASLSVKTITKEVV